jgi:hypothetical protein
MRVERIDRMDKMTIDARRIRDQPDAGLAEPPPGSIEE